MGQALYRKYRPKKLSEIVGEEHITSTLTNALKNGQLSHAYLFTGPRGVGKTSVARILAHEINNFEYSDDSSYIDIIEIDAASNRRIDEIRQLRDQVNVAPSLGKYKVYIIDEVHMLTREAFNALLKTLEEPPEHVVFILATTESHKVPDTIVSRTQQFNFRPIVLSQIEKQLKAIAKSEKIEADDKAIQIIAEYGQGSFRDSISLLDQANSISGKITELELINLLGLAPSTIIESIVSNIEASDINKILDITKKIDDDGYNITVVCKQLIEELKKQLVSDKSSISSKDILIIIKDLLDVPQSSDTSTSLEVVLIEAVLNNRPTQTNEAQTPQSKPDMKTKEKLTPAAKPELIVEPTILKERPVTMEPTSKSSKTKQIVKKIKYDENIWEELLDLIKARYNTLYGIIRMAVPVFENDNITMKVKFDFHQRLLSDPKNQTILIDFIKQLTGEEVSIKAIVDKKVKLETREEREKDLIDENQSITTINNIFGSSEVLE